MLQLLIYNYRIPVANVTYKRICQFGDTHLTCWDALSSDEEKHKASARSEDWIRGRFAFAKAHNEPCGEAQALPAERFFEALLEKSKEADVLIMAGDIVEFNTDGNTRLLDNALKNYPIPYLPLCGNHDEPEKLPTGHPFKAAEKAVQRLDLEDMVILGFNNSKRIITKTQIEILKSTLCEGKPVLIAMHIPIMTENGNDYYFLDYEGCPDENRMFVNLIKENADKVIAVTCGHLHYSSVAELCPGVTQYVSSQGLTGSLSIYEIGEIE